MLFLQILWEYVGPGISGPTSYGIWTSLEKRVPAGLVGDAEDEGATMEGRAAREEEKEECTSHKLRITVL